MINDKIINPDGSVKGETFSKNYSGEYPSPLYGEETYKDYYNRVVECKKKGFHLGDLSWGDYSDYCLGSPPGRGEYVQNYIIGEVPDDAWEPEEENLWEDW